MTRGACLMCTVRFRDCFGICVSLLINGVFVTSKGQCIVEKRINLTTDL